MRIGIARSASTHADGGIFQYEIVFLKALSEIAARFSEEFVYLTHYANDLPTLAGAGGLSYLGLPVRPLIKPSAQRAPPDTYVKQKPPTPAPLDPNAVEFRREADNPFRQAGIDLVMQLSPDLGVHAFAFRLPLVVPIFDLNHRLQPEFPEVSDFGVANYREYFYINVCRYATLVLAESETGKADVLRFYGDLIDADRIRVLPSYPAIERKALPDARELDRVRAKYSLPQRYFFYPASFYRHKNHELILRAVKLIADQTGEAVPVVFSGGYQDYIRALNFKEVVALAMKLGIADRVRYLGVVPDEDMAALYAASAGLVMPTFFGPTNIPPLEAWHYGRPVITSDIPGIREQIGDAGLLVNPRSAPDLAQAMLRLWKDETLAAQLAERGRQRLASHSWESYVGNVAGIMTEACERVRAGRTPRYPDLNPA